MATNVHQVQNVLTTAREQRELFCWKFPEIPREDVTQLMNDFEKRDQRKKGEIEHHDTLLLMEKRGSIHTAAELRQMVLDMDYDKNNKISFLELCCAIFHKSWDDLNNFVDENARARALEGAMKASEEARKAEEAIEAARRAEELAAQERAAKLEKEASLSGVRRAAAFFSRQIEESSDSTKTNAEKIHEEATRRMALRKAKSDLAQAVAAANKQRSAEEVAAELKAQSERMIAEEAARKKAAEDAEKAERAARKAALNAQWGGQSPPVTPKSGKS